MNYQIMWKKGENSAMIPGAVLNNRFLAFHSLKNPLREADRVEESSKNSNFLIIIGGGGLYHIPDVKYRRLIVLIVPDNTIYNSKYNTERIRKIQTRSDIVSVIRGCNEGIENFTVRIRQIMSRYYYPLFHSYHIYQHKSIEKIYKNEFISILTTLKDSLITSRADYSTQQKYAALWFYHSIRNLIDQADSINNSKYLWNNLINKAKGKQIIITGAGPDLENSYTAINEKNNCFIIACDTSIPSLVFHNIHPDIVVSIDPQYYSLLHYLEVQDSKFVLMFDIGIHPSIARKFKYSIPCASMHPFIQNLILEGMGGINLDFYGTNVAIVAISIAFSLAYSLGSTEINTYGIEFRNSRAKRYAQGSFQYTWSYINADRIHSSENYHYTLASSHSYIDNSNNSINYISDIHKLTKAEFEMQINKRGNYILYEDPVRNYNIIPKFNRKAEFASGNIQNIMKLYIHRLYELSENDIQEFISYFFTRSQKKSDKHNILVSLMPLWAYFIKKYSIDYLSKEIYVLQFLQFIRQKISRTRFYQNL